MDKPEDRAAAARGTMGARDGNSSKQPRSSKPHGEQPHHSTQQSSKQPRSAQQHKKQPRQASRYRASKQPQAGQRPRAASFRRRPARRPAREPLGTKLARLPRPVKAAAGIAVLALAAFIVWQNVRPITVTVNGTDVQIDERTVQAAFETAGEPAVPGDLYDIEGELLEEGGGGEVVVAVNEKIKNMESRVHDGDAIVFLNGDDEEEASVVLEDQVLDFEVVEEGHGPIYTVAQEGKTGVGTVQYGTVSQKTVVLEVSEEPVDAIYLRWTPDTGSDKVIALTFDDGPTSTYTAEILDVLAEYGAKATFFTIGEQITGTGAELVLREYQEGHQVCTHTWDHASGSGGA